MELEKKTTKHCPKCDYEGIRWQINIFNNEPTGDCICDSCKYKCKNKDLITKVWVSEESLQSFINKQRDEGNLQSEKGFSPALCLSSLLQALGELK